jgi:ABC-2 type transport system ATP-binding protein
VRLSTHQYFSRNPGIPKSGIIGRSENAMFCPCVRVGKVVAGAPIRIPARLERRLGSPPRSTSGDHVLMTSPHWFRRRRSGVGWRPASRPGWAITAVAVAAVVAAVTLLRGSPARVPVIVLVVGCFAVVARVTGGSGPSAAAEQPNDDEPATALGSTEQRQALRALAGRSVAGAAGAAVAVEHLTKRFGDRVAVDDLSFEVAAGEVFGFLGPNGAGKTTTVRMLATLIAPTSGTARVAGIDLAAGDGLEIRKRIAVMTENPGLYLRLTVDENLEFFAGLHELRDPRQRVRDALAAVNLADRAGDLCGSLSKGLRQRVALARALLGEPTVLFLDEPTSGLDPLAARDVHELIDGLREHGVTVFLTTHRLDEAERLCDRVAILNTRLQTIGRPDELRDRLFTKTLIVRTASPVSAPGTVFDAPGVESWRADGTNRYVLAVSDARVAAPEVTRALVAAGADVLSLSEGRHSLEDVYVELIEQETRAEP